jgi:lipopolysaccharide cholinephosphotransferase
LNDKELKKLHQKILEIAIYFDNFCKENDIVYYLMGGTALGAMRHKGFIPWDDDFDVFMNFENYNKFLKVAESKLDKERFYFQKEDTQEWPMFFSKIRMNGTTFIEKDIKDRKMHHGIYIDVMCLNNTHGNKVLRYLQYFAARVLNTKVLADKGYITTNKFKKIALNISKVLVTEKVKNTLLTFVRSFNNKPSLMVGHFFGRAPFTRTSFPTSYLGQPRYVEFENIKLPVVHEVEKYLIVRYGKNYMQLPSEVVKMQYPSHAYIVDTEKSYKEYCE